MSDDPAEEAEANKGTRTLRKTDIRVLLTAEAIAAAEAFRPKRAMADISVAVNRANPRVSLGRNGACACFYCQAVRKGAEKE